MKNKIIFDLFQWLLVFLFNTAIIKFFDTGFSSGVVWLCLGSAFLCFGASAQSKNKKSDDKETSDKK